MRPLVAAFAICSLSGCAAVLGTKQKDFDLQSSPEGADVFLDGNRVATTPAKVKLSNQAQHTFVFKKEGYKDASCTLARGTGAGWVIFDVITGLVPIIIDAATSSWSQTKGSNCTGSLQPITSPVAQLPATPVNASVAQLAPAPVPTPDLSPSTAPPPGTPPLSVPPVDTATPPQPYVQPIAGYTQLPPGTSYVGDARIKKFYPPGCAAQHAIPPEQQIFFQTAEGAVRDGFTRSGDC
jgi:hypothetical protein